MKVADYQIIIMRGPEHLTGHYHHHYHHYHHYHHHCGHQLISDGLTGLAASQRRDELFLCWPRPLLSWIVTLRGETR